MNTPCCNLSIMNWQEVVQPVKACQRSQTKVIVPLGPATENVEILQELIGVGAQLFYLENQVGCNIETQIKNLLEAARIKQQQVICGILQMGGSSSSSSEHVLQDMDMQQGAEEGSNVLGKRKAAGPSYLRHNDLKNLQTATALLEIPYVVLSQCRNIRDIQHIKCDLEELGLQSTKIICKVDNWQMLKGNFREYVDVVDGILIDREALGSEWEKETDFIIRLPLVQKKIIKICNFAGKPVLINGVADSLQTLLRPTRAEATDIANIVLDGVDGIVLGTETYEGKYPVNVFATVQSMCNQAEIIFDNKAYMEQIDDYLHNTKQIDQTIKLGTTSNTITPSVSIENLPAQNGHTQHAKFNNTKNPMFNFLNLNGACYAAVKTSYLSQIDGIVLAVGDDEGCEQLSQLKPKCPIFVLISNTLICKGIRQEAGGQLLAARSCLRWGVQPVFVEEQLDKNVNAGDVQNVLRQKYGQGFQKLVLILRDDLGNHLIKFNFQV
eukprot:TRINITY_DN6336_c0_g1_i9.p1 TRINITY_DN6336_c0_g1~~TRINITY_DN6336_c0_g1_i9.p1  ORF type:complete len:496 (+),score=78.66 TRINITY_DN6336_c0_g1_i9:300-1787(+)